MAALALSSCGLRASFLTPALFSMFIPPPTKYPRNIERACCFGTESLICFPPAQSAILQWLKALGSRRLPVLLLDGREFKRQCPSLLPPFSLRSGCKDE